MILFVLAYLAGVLTIVSPCILPVLPFVFTSARQSFLRSGLPLLMGMAATFAAVASLAAVAGGWAVTVNRVGRIAAMALLALFGLALLFPALAERAARPLVALGARLSRSAGAEESGVRTSGATHHPRPRRAAGSSFVLGIATGFLWAPCAGPVLGLILTMAALQGASARTSLLLFVYALGAATSLAVALLIGGRALAAMKRSLGASEWVRRILGLAVLAAVAAVALGLGTGFLTRLSIPGSNAIEQGLLDRFHANALIPGNNVNNGPIDPFEDLPPSPSNPTLAQKLANLPIEGQMPSLNGAVAWLNSAPLTTAQLKGKVVLVDFWTYSCINCLRSIPYVEAWARKYASHGLVVIGVHTPEFAFEKNLDNVRRAVTQLGITFPVAVDSNYALWRAFDNDAWPGDYFIDAQGRIRAEHFGEGENDIAEGVIQQLLKQAGQTRVPGGVVTLQSSGAEAAADFNDLDSSETYIGYQKAAGFISPGGEVRDVSHSYVMGTPQFGQWGLAGQWTVGPQRAVLDAAGGSIVMRFHARDLHMVLAPGPDGVPIRFRVTLDGRPPGEEHGSDVDAEGNGIVTRPQLYQLIRQSGAITDHTFEIRFQDAGVQAYSFTFG